MNARLQEKISGNFLLLYCFPSFLFFLVLLAYLPGMTGPFVFDDIWQILLSREEPSFKNRGITHLTFSFNHRFNFFSSPGFEFLTTLGGNYTLVWHLTNLFLHLFCACALFVFLRSVWYPSSAFYRPFFITLFFSLHPLASEAILYTQARSVILMNFFWLLFLSCIGAQGKKRRIWAFFCFLGAVGSKEVALFYLPLSGIIYYFLGGGYYPLRKSSSLVVFSSADSAHPVNKENKENKEGTSSSYLLYGSVALMLVPSLFFAPAIFARWETLSGFKNFAWHFVGFWHYLYLLSVPLSSLLCFDHYYPYQNWPLLSTGILSLSAFSLLFFFISYFKQKLPREDQRRLLFCCWWGIIILLPYALIPTRFIVVEYRAYPLLIPFLLFIFLLGEKIYSPLINFISNFVLKEREVFPKISFFLKGVFISLFILCLFFQTNQRSQVWQNTISLYQDVLDKNEPSRWTIDANLVKAYFATGQITQKKQKNLARYCFQEGERGAIKFLQQYKGSFSIRLDIICSLFLFYEQSKQYRKVLTLTKEVFWAKMNQEETWKKNNLKITTLQFFLIKCYFKEGDIETARKMFQEINKKKLPTETQIGWSYWEKKLSLFSPNFQNTDARK